MTEKPTTEKPKRRDYFFLSNESKIFKRICEEEHNIYRPKVDYSADQFHHNRVGLFEQLRNPESELRKGLKANPPDAFYIEDMFDIERDKNEFPEGVNNPTLALEKLVLELKRHYSDIPVIAMTISNSHDILMPGSENERGYRSLLKSKEVDGTVDISEKTTIFPDALEKALATAKAKKAHGGRPMGG